MLAGGNGGGTWSQNVDCDIFPLHYLSYLPRILCLCVCVCVSQLQKKIRIRRGRIVREE